MLNVALPKGRLGDRVYELFESAGYECPEIREKNRKLIFENEEKGIRYFWAKPSDVGTYVEKGAADIGIAGKDILFEYSPDVYELADLDTGKCKMAVAGRRDIYEKNKDSLIVATKFRNTAEKYFMKKGMNIEIIELNGSIEIAPVIGLSHVIVDIVETGNTLRENNLEVIEEIMPISARLIANRSGYEFKKEKIDEIALRLKEMRR